MGVSPSTAVIERDAHVVDFCEIIRHVGERRLHAFDRRLFPDDPMGFRHLASDRANQHPPERDMRFEPEVRQDDGEGITDADDRFPGVEVDNHLRVDAGRELDVDLAQMAAKLGQQLKGRVDELGRQQRLQSLFDRLGVVVLRDRRDSLCPEGVYDDPAVVRPAPSVRCDAARAAASAPAEDREPE